MFSTEVDYNVINKIGWFDQELRTMREHLRWLGDISRQYNTYSNTHYYTKYKQEYRKAISKAKISANDNYISHSSNAIKYVAVVNTNIASTKKDIESKNLTFDPFNKYFLKIAHTLVESIP